MKSFCKSFFLQQLTRQAVLGRCSLHLGLDFPVRAKESRGDSKDVPAVRGDSKTVSDDHAKAKRAEAKVSATVRVSCLPKDEKTELEPEKLRNAEEAIAAITGGPKRSEFQQRETRKSECANQLKDLAAYRESHCEITVCRMPFVKTAYPNERYFERAEDLLKMESDPVKLAKWFLQLKKELQVEREKTEAITQKYLELEAELHAKICAKNKEQKESSKSVTPASKDKRNKNTK